MALSDNRIGEAIYAIRKYHGWTMERLGQELGVTRSSINGYEKNRNMPPDRIFEQLLRLDGHPYVSVFEFKNGIHETTATRLFLNDRWKISGVPLSKDGLLYLLEVEPSLTSCPAYIAELEKRDLELCNRFDFESLPEYREQLPAILEFLKKEKGLEFGKRQ